MDSASNFQQKKSDFKGNSIEKTIFIKLHICFSVSKASVSCFVSVSWNIPIGIRAYFGQYFSIVHPFQLVFFDFVSFLIGICRSNVFEFSFLFDSFEIALKNVAKQSSLFNFL